MNHYQQLENQLRSLPLGLAGEKFIREVDAAVDGLFDVGGFDLDNVASQLHISTSQLRRHLLAYTDVPPARYIMHLRLRECLRLFVDEPQMTISAIARRCGFFDHSHFTHTFMRQFGMTPRQYQLGAHATASNHHRIQ